MNTYSVQLLSVLRDSGLINPSRRRCGPTRRVLLSLSLLDREGRGVPQLSGFFTGGLAEAGQEFRPCGLHSGWWLLSALLST